MLDAVAALARATDEFETVIREGYGTLREYDPNWPPAVRA
jgi:hypothetical protein